MVVAQHNVVKREEGRGLLAPKMEIPDSALIANLRQALAPGELQAGVAYVLISLTHLPLATDVGHKALRLLWTVPTLRRGDEGSTATDFVQVMPPPFIVTKRETSLKTTPGKNAPAQPPYHVPSLQAFTDMFGLQTMPQPDMAEAGIQPQLLAALAATKGPSEVLIPPKEAAYVRAPGTVCTRPSEVSAAHPSSAAACTRGGFPAGAPVGRHDTDMLSDGSTDEEVDDALEVLSAAGGVGTVAPQAPPPAKLSRREDRFEKERIARERMLVSRFGAPSIPEVAGLGPVGSLSSAAFAAASAAVQAAHASRGPRGKKRSRAPEQSHQETKPSPRIRVRLSGMVQPDNCSASSTGASESDEAEAAAALATLVSAPLQQPPSSGTFAMPHAPAAGPPPRSGAQPSFSVAVSADMGPLPNAHLVGGAMHARAWQSRPAWSTLGPVRTAMPTGPAYHPAPSVSVMGTTRQSFPAQRDHAYPRPYTSTAALSGAMPILPPARQLLPRRR